MRTTGQPGGGLLLLVLVLLAPLALIPSASAGKKKNKPPKAARARDYDVAPSPGDTRVWKVTYHAWGIENVTGEETLEYFATERVAGPFAHGKHKQCYQLYDREGDDVFNEYFTVKKGQMRVVESRVNDENWAYKKPMCWKSKMKFGKTYRKKNQSFYQDFEDDFEARILHLWHYTTSLGGAWSGEWTAFDDTIVITNVYDDRTEDSTVSWEGSEEIRYARGVGKVYEYDAWTYENRYYSALHKFRIGYELTLELAYASIRGVEYGDPDAVNW
jgi:hypothetical protein